VRVTENWRLPNRTSQRSFHRHPSEESSCSRGDCPTSSPAASVMKNCLLATEVLLRATPSAIGRRDRSCGLSRIWFRGKALSPAQKADLGCKFRHYDVRETAWRPPTTSARKLVAGKRCGVVDSVLHFLGQTRRHRIPLRRATSRPNAPFGVRVQPRTKNVDWAFCVLRSQRTRARDGCCYVTGQSRGH